MAGSGSGNKPPVDDEDWLSALDEWDSQLDGALGGEKPAPTATPDSLEPILTQSDLPVLGAAVEAGDLEAPGLDPTPLDEPPPLDDAVSMGAFGFELETVQQAALPAAFAVDDPMRDLFEGEAADETIAVSALPRVAVTPADPVAVVPSQYDEAPLEEHADFAEEGATRVAAAAEIAPLLVWPANEAPLDDEADELEISVEVSSALEEAAVVAGELVDAPAPPPPIDDDFYDDISIVPGREEPSSPRAVVPAPPEMADPVEPLWSEPGLVVRSPDDPDRTPLPGALIVASPGAAQRFFSTAELPQLPQRELVARRPERPVPLLEARLIEDQERGTIFGEAERRDFLALLDTERLLLDGERASLVAFESAMVCVQLGDTAGTAGRAGAALAGLPEHAGALALARRCALTAGDLELASELVARELRQAAPRERAGLVELAMTVGDRRGEHPAARALARSVEIGEGPDAAGERLAALAFTVPTVAEISACRGCLSSCGDPRLLAALDLMQARLQAATSDESAAESFRAANLAEGRSLHAALGLVRLGARGNAPTLEREGFEWLAEALPPSALRVAVERHLAAALFFDGANEEALARLAALADAGDELSARLWSVDRVAPAVLDVDLARMERALVSTPDRGQRASLRFAIGLSEEARGHVAAAIAAYAEASRDNSADRRAERALERARSIGGDKQVELARQLRIAGTDDARAAWALTRAGALLLELGRGEEAIERAMAALDRFPSDGEALALCAQLAAPLGQFVAVAERFCRAAETSPDSAHAVSLRHRAATLFSVGGEPSRALALVAEGRDVEEVADEARRLGLDDLGALRRLLGELAERSTPTAAARALFESATIAASPGDAAYDLLRAARLQPGGAATLALATRLVRQSDSAACALFLAERNEALSRSASTGVVAPGERERAAIEAALALSLDGEDLEKAANSLVDLLGTSESDSARADLARLARLRGRDPGLTSSYGAALEVVTAPEQRAGLLYGWARVLQRGGDPDRALAKLRLAHEALPEARVYREALERAWERAGETARLADLALQDLKDAPDTRSKVAAYARLAFIDECLRGDSGSARMSYESIAELDQHNQDAARRVERYLIAERRSVDLIHLYDGLGLASSAPAVSVAITLERARLRRRVAGGLDVAELDATTDNDIRLALFQNPRSRPALREAYARAVERKDASARAELSLRLAELCGASEPPDPRAGAIFMVRAAESLVQLGRDDDAIARLREAVVSADTHLPALVTLLDLALRKSDWRVAADAAEQIQRVQREPVARRDAGLLAAALCVRDLEDRPRAVRLLRAVLEAEPRAELAYARLRALLAEVEDWAGLAALIETRLEVEGDPARCVDLHVELAGLAREHLADPARVRKELTAALATAPAHGEAMARMADLEEAEGRWAEAADLLLRRAKAERQRGALANILYRLGVLYARHLQDSKRAVACFTRVLQVDPDRRDALALIADSYSSEHNWPGALAALSRLASLEQDPAHRIELMHRAARIQEDGLNDPRQALAQYRAALELSPLHLPAVDALAQFYDRHSDTQSLRVLVDTTARRLRSGLSGGPRDIAAFSSLYRVFTMRRAPDRAAMAAGVLAWMGAVGPDEQQALDRLRSREQYPGAALADPTVDEQLFDARVPAGFRNLMRLVEEPLLKTFRADVKQLGLQRADRLPRSGHGLRDIGNRVAADLGIRDWELYVSPTLKRSAVLELTEPLSVCIGADLLEGAHELELRFLFARLFKMAQARLSLALRLSPDALAALVAGVVRQFIADFEPVGVDPAQLAVEATRAQRALSKKLLTEAHPFALECAAPSAELLSLSAGVAAAADRAGLIACGAPGPALTMLERMGMAGAARALALFCVGDELPELRRVVGTSIG